MKYDVYINLGRHYIGKVEADTYEQAINLAEFLPIDDPEEFLCDYDIEVEECYD